MGKLRFILTNHDSDQAFNSNCVYSPAGLRCQIFYQTHDISSSPDDSLHTFSTYNKCMPLVCVIVPLPQYKLPNYLHNIKPPIINHCSYTFMHHGFNPACWFCQIWIGYYSKIFCFTAAMSTTVPAGPSYSLLSCPEYFDAATRGSGRLTTKLTLPATETQLNSVLHTNVCIFTAAILYLHKSS